LEVIQDLKALICLGVYIDQVHARVPVLRRCLLLVLHHGTKLRSSTTFLCLTGLPLYDKIIAVLMVNPVSSLEALGHLGAAEAVKAAILDYRDVLLAFVVGGEQTGRDSCVVRIPMWLSVRVLESELPALNDRHVFQAG
jgi:hypothetical protein